MSTGHSDRPSLEEQVQILTKRLQQAQKLTALGELVSTTTHEFNNVLMTIINYAKMGMRCRDDATRDKALDKILIASEKAARITNSILGVARNRSETLEPTELPKLIDDSLVLLEREMSKYRISVERQIGNVPPAMANGNQIQQILLNLLINARQAMPNGGRIVIKLDYDPAEDMVVLVVRDDGQGIPAEKLPRIFDPFYTTKSGPDETGKGGTGLGLSSCRNIVEAHHGRIRVNSTVGKGTAFTILLPVAKPSNAPVVEQQLGVPAAEGVRGF
jgi:signal transduction histidine kinase